MKFSRQLVFACNSLAVLVLTACSDSALERHQAEDDFTYLNTKAFQQWRLPEGAVPQFSSDYIIPQGHYAGHLGESVDIRAPEEVLELLAGMRTEIKQGVVLLEFSRPELAARVWEQLADFLRQNHVPFDKKDNSVIESGRVVWTPEDEHSSLSGQYRFTQRHRHNRTQIMIELINLEQSGESRMNDIQLVERYSAMMANTVTTQVEEQRRKEEERKALENRRHIAIQMGSDRSGFPVIIARSEYAVIWPRLPDVLNQIGFVIDDRSRSEGSIKVKYTRPSDEAWQTIGVEPLSILNGNYTLMLGDLENRTSINVTNSKGKPISEADLKTFAPVLSTLFSR